MQHSSGAMAAASFTGQPSVKGRSETLRMILLTLNSIGITFTWGVEMTCTCKIIRRDTRMQGLHANGKQTARRTCSTSA